MGGNGKYPSTSCFWKGASVLLILSALSCAQNRVQPDEYVQAVRPAATRSESHGENTADVKMSTLDHRNLSKAFNLSPNEYTLGVEDVIQIDLIKPERLSTLATVAPDGLVTFPYIGNVIAKGCTIAQVQEEIQMRLAKGYMKYPVVSVSLKESRSRKYFVYGEVLKPGSYPLEENMTTLQAISMAGGFTRFGSANRVKILRPKKNGPGYFVNKVDIQAVMEGEPDKDILLVPGDIVVVSEGVF